MHVYNAWLPPPVAQQTILETKAFSESVQRLQRDWDPQSPISALATLKWISVFNNFLKAKSELAIADIQLLVQIILDIFHNSEDNYYVQARWGRVLSGILKKYAKKLSLTLDWRPFYGLFMRSLFKRQSALEGVVLKGSQVMSLYKIIRKCRRFFTKSSAVEIWAEFRPFLDDLSHNASLEGAGFISLFLPTNGDVDPDFFTSEWFAECLLMWGGIPNCSYWDLQWASLVGRCIKNHLRMPNLSLEKHVESLFSHCLRSFEVPVGKMGASYPYQRAVTKEVARAFYSDLFSLPEKIAKTIVYLLKPESSAQRHLEKMIDLLEQYYHPSNGGSWTSFLERFLRSSVKVFMKRLAKEHRERSILPAMSVSGYNLTSKERQGFVKEVMRLIEKGQFSKNTELANTAAKASLDLAYVEPSLVLPLIITRFQAALDTMTATHQLEAALKTLALSARALLVASSKDSPSSMDTFDKIANPVVNYSGDFVTSCRDVLELAIVQSVSGLDANDPPKTLATLQLLCSVISNLGKLGNEHDGASSLLSIDWSQWLDDFLSHLFSLLLHVEPSNQTAEISEINGSTLSPRTFLVQSGSFYCSTLELLLSRLDKSLFQQALKKIANFIHNQMLPGAVVEMGLLCSALMYANPVDVIPNLMMPIMRSVFSSLQECPPTGFSGLGEVYCFDPKLRYSPALEASIVYQLDLLCLGVSYGGECVLQCRQLLKNIIAASFDAPSAKVNEAGSCLLSSILSSTILFYPRDQYKLHSEYPASGGLEDWVTTKGDYTFVNENMRNDGPVWHMPNPEEIQFANELLDLHLRGALGDLKRIIQFGNAQSQGNAAQEKEHVRVVLMRIDASIQGVRSCLPDFEDPRLKDLHGESQLQPGFLAGMAGANVGSTELRESASETLHLACQYLLKDRADDIRLLSLLVHSIAIIVNSGSSEFSEWSTSKRASIAGSKSLIEPSTNFISGFHAKGSKRPKWMVIEDVLLHNMWRASQCHYNQYRFEVETASLPHHITLLISDLVQLSLHNYDVVREKAAAALKEIFKRFPSSISEALPVLFNSLQDSCAPEHAAIGAGAVLASRPVSRYFTQDFSAFSLFLTSLLNSAHHEGVKAQSAINQLFVVFIMLFGGLPKTYKVGDLERVDPSLYADLACNIQSMCCRSDSIHWRYNLMAQGMLILLSEDLALHDTLSRHFLSSLRSELPPLRPLSVVALLLLLHHPGHEPLKTLPDGTSSESIAIHGGDCGFTLLPILQEKNFGTVVLQNLSLDHHFEDVEVRTRQGNGGRLFAEFAGAASLTTWMQIRLHDWPRTRTWDWAMKGDSFSPKFAKLFKRLVQECGPVVLEAFHGPLNEVISAVGERGEQCAAAEVIAGFLHSDMDCVLKAWNEWLHQLLRQLLCHSSVESTADWSACIRFAVTGKGRLGRRPPLMRTTVLNCLAELLYNATSSSAIVKHFTFLSAAVTELFPSKEFPGEVLFQHRLLMKSLTFLQNPAPQVREVVGTIICLISANIELACRSQSVVKASRQEEQAIGTADWKVLLVSQANSAAVKCQADSSEEDVKEAIRIMETVLHFLMTAMKSGRSTVLNDILADLLQPILSLQETCHKELSSLAKMVLHLLKFQTLPVAELQGVSEALLSAARDANWHTRIAALGFLQPFVYRHTYILPKNRLARIWQDVQSLLSDIQLEVRELASLTLAGMMKGADEALARDFRENNLDAAFAFLNSFKRQRRGKSAAEIPLPAHAVHAIVLGLAACVLSSPYDVPSWLPKTLTTLARFAQHESAPVRTTVKRTLAEFRRTHADTWAIQKSLFTEEELEVLLDTSSSASYFA